MSSGHSRSEVMYADDAGIINIENNTAFASCLAECNSLQCLYCSHNSKLIVAICASGLGQPLGLLRMHPCSAECGRAFSVPPYVRAAFSWTLPMSLEFAGWSEDLSWQTHLPSRLCCMVQPGRGVALSARKSTPTRFLLASGRAKWPRPRCHALRYLSLFDASPSASQMEGKGCTCIQGERVRGMGGRGRLPRSGCDGRELCS